MKIEKQVLTKEFLKSIKAIDDTYYTNTIIPLQWYYDRYLHNTESYILYDEEKIVGYIIDAKISKDLFNAFESGALTGDIEINPNMFVDESNYHYISSVVLLEKYREKGYGTQLIQKVIQNAKGKYVAITVSNGGYKLMKKFIKNGKEIYDNKYVFTFEK